MEKLKTQVEIKLTFKVPFEKVDEVSQALLDVVKEKDVWDGKLEQSQVEIDFG